MSMVSPRLHRDMNRRVRAAYSVDVDKHRCSSVPTASIRYQCSDQMDTADATRSSGFRGYRASAIRSRLMSPTKHIRVARSEPPPSSAGRYLAEVEDRSHPRREASSRCAVGQAKHDDPKGQRGDLIKQRALAPPTVSSTIGLSGPPLEVNVKAPLSVEDGFLSAAENSTQSSPTTTAEGAGKVGLSRGQTEAPIILELQSPKKLMQVMEERDRAIHVCLQYRCKLKNTEGSLRAEERLASDLKAQLREANAAGEATRKLFDQVMDKVRADEGRKLRQEVDNRQDDRHSARLSEQARKSRLQLTRARKDLRELWLERDELALLAGQAMQGEAEGCKRIKKLEFIVSGLKEQAATRTLSEEKAAEGMARAEARAELAELAERELRESVKAIKADFEILVGDLRSREKQIRCLEAKNATLANKAVTVASTALESTHSRYRQRPDVSATITGDNIARSVKRTHPGAKVEAATGLPRDKCASRGEPRASAMLDINARTSNSAVVLKCEQKHQARRKAPQNAVFEVSRDANTTPSTARLSRKTLTPPTSEVRGRAATISYPRRGSRTTFTPMSLSCRENVGTTVTPPGNGNKASEGPSAGAVEEGQRAARQGEAPGEVGQNQRERGPITFPSPGDQHLNRGDVQDDPFPTRKCRHPSIMPPLPATGTDPPRSSAVVATGPRVALGKEQSPDPAKPAILKPEETAKVAEEAGGEKRGDEETLRTTRPELETAADGVVEEACRLPAQPAAAAAGNGVVAGSAEPDRAQRSVHTGGSVEEIDGEARHGVEDDAAPSSPRRPDEVQVGEDPRGKDFRWKLMDGVPVLKYGGRGKPKAKTLWVTPDLSEIFYTQAGRTKNSKKSARMPLAGLCASRGRHNCPDLLRAPIDDHCFALVHQTDSCLAGDSPHHREKEEGHAADKPEGSSEAAGFDGGGGSPEPGRRNASSTPGSVTAAAAGGARRHPVGGRERMGLETASAEECTALIDEINELVRLAGLKDGGGGSSQRGRELFDE
ncbi:unnamed protein product, partial [Scytosiphon promiscuus]